MKKIFITLTLFVIFNLFLNNSKVSASFFADNFGTNMTYKTLFLYDDFEFTGNWWESQSITYVFEYQPVEESLEELIRAWQDAASLFMDLYTPVITLEYLTNTNSIPSNNWGWTVEDGLLYIIIEKDYFEEYYPGEPILPIMGDLAEVIRVDTWVITESTPDYQLGYNTGYQQGYNAGFQSGHNQGYNEGFSDGETTGYNDGFDDGYNQGHDDGFNEGAIIGYDIGYNDGLHVSQGEAYDKGYMDGANESFIATLDKWLVPAIIIVMLAGGYFAIARKKRDGDI